MGLAASAPPKGERVWVTGASGGLGKAVALKYAARNADLVLSSRSEEALQRVAKECETAGAAGAECVVMDQADPASVREALARATTRKLDVVVLNGARPAENSQSSTPQRRRGTRRFDPQAASARERPRSTRTPRR